MIELKVGQSDQAETYRLEGSKVAEMYNIEQNDIRGKSPN